MENKYYIYLHVKLLTGEPFYVGKGKCGTNRFKAIKNRSKWWCNIVEKHGFDIIIIDDNLSPEDACEKEIYWIKRIGRKDLELGNLVNLTDGGEGTNGRKVPLEHRLIGEKNPFYGKKHTEETGKIIAKANKNRIWKQSSLDKISKSRKGIPIFSEKAKEERRLKMLGNNNPMYGKKHSEEVRKKMRESDRNTTGCIVLNTETGIFFNSIKEAANAFNLKRTTLNFMLIGRYINKTSLLKV